MNVDAAHWGASGDHPLGYAADLFKAFHDAALSAFRIPSTLEDAPAEARAAALRLAVAIGRCRLFGVDAGEQDGSLPTNAATAAAAELAIALEQWRDDALSHPKRFDEAAPLEAEDLCADLLEQRMAAWAAFVAIEESYDDALDASDPNLEALHDAMEEALNRLEKFDGLLTQEEFLSLLSVTAGSRLLDNWRGMLAPSYRDPPPWWLDGTLEEVARRTAESFQSAEVAARRGGGRAAQRWFEIAAVAAAAPSSVEAPFLSWTSPDGDAFALLPRKAGSPDDVALVEFSDRDGRPLVALAGRTVRLGDLRSTVDGEGRARFLAGDLAELAARRPAPPKLVVGEEGAVWTPTP
jgi:hypothetical protein